MTNVMLAAESTCRPGARGVDDGAGLSVADDVAVGDIVEIGPGDGLGSAFAVDRVVSPSATNQTDAAPSATPRENMRPSDLTRGVQWLRELEYVKPDEDKSDDNDEEINCRDPQERTRPIALHYPLRVKPCAARVA